MSLFSVEDWKKSPYWNIILLALAWAFTLTTSTLLTTVGPLSAQYLGYSTSVASSTIGVFLFGAAMSSIPSGWLFRAFGRYWGFSIGCGFQLLGCILGCIALAVKSIDLLLVGCFAIGLAQGLGQFYRFYVVEVTPEDLKSRAVTYVLTGGIIAAFLGPYVATHSVKLFPIDYLGSYMMIGLFAMLNQSVVSCTSFHPSTTTSSSSSHSTISAHGEDEEHMMIVVHEDVSAGGGASYDTFGLPAAEARIARNEEHTTAISTAHEHSHSEHDEQENVIVLGEESVERRSICQIITTPIFLFSCLVATLAHTMMVMIMSTISLEVMAVYASSYTLALQYTSYIMQLHFLAMFAPGFFTGLLIEYYGSFLIALVGGIIFLLALFILTVQQQFDNYLFGMMLLGLGWNFAFSAGTVMLTTCYTVSHNTILTHSLFVDSPFVYACL
jgi:MFS family permease